MTRRASLSTRLRDFDMRTQASFRKRWRYAYVIEFGTAAPGRLPRRFGHFDPPDAHHHYAPMELSK